MREAECAYRLECDKIMRSTAKELMPKHLYQYTAVDVCTRWAYRIISARKNRETAQLFMSDVMIHAPFRINKVQTDNGTEFTLSDLEKKNPKEKNKKTPFEELLMDNGIEHHLNEKGKPWQNGFVESQHRLDREWFYAHIRITSMGQIRRALEDYNEKSMHYVRICLGGKSVAEQISDFVKVA